MGLVLLMHLRHFYRTTEHILIKLVRDKEQTFPYKFLCFRSDPPISEATTAKNRSRTVPPSDKLLFQNHSLQRRKRRHKKRSKGMYEEVLLSITPIQN